MSAPSPLTLDVREILRSGGEPFGEIMHAVASLTSGQSLRLLATFKPVPLFAVMAQKGYAHAEREIGNGDWEVLFTPTPLSGSSANDGSNTAVKAAAQPASWGDPAQTLDNRGLQPPEPLVRTLETLGTLTPGAVIEVLTDREPLFLYTELKVRGHEFRAEARGSEGYRLLIRRGGEIAA
ncbi:MAG TPA: DUF2249 domain-containing protein [Alphaproteobacteria bacterium]|nr:DUF2249 domain-containing protein [Alphaproteobacteria bacterium]